MVPFLDSDGTTTLSPDSDSDEEAFLPEAGTQTITAKTDPSTPACAWGSTVDKLKIAIIRLP